MSPPSPGRNVCRTKAVHSEKVPTVDCAFSGLNPHIKFILSSLFIACCLIINTIALYPSLLLTIQTQYSNQPTFSFLINRNDGLPYLFCSVEFHFLRNHYNRFMLSRNHFETPLLSSARLAKRTLVIYGQSAAMVTTVLHERGYKAVHLSGSKLSSYGLRGSEIYEIFNVFPRKRARRGSRLWRSTSSSRLRSVDSKSRLSVNKAKAPWKY
ncbi:unnamed protein product [Haemonchus placei]|uniref:Rhodanese domain-containing protein n=1 Tax=Haemonchus placei TaxID=6290 RepID=A0A0N4VTF0_HAEPC|nr:unnamed protein product [Haemonchus placei]